MKGLLQFALLMLINTFAAANSEFPRFALDKIEFQTTAKQWVSTQSALLTVSINMTMSNADLVKARAEILTNLNKIAAGDWHILGFDRAQDSSGLEKLAVEAQARIVQKDLTDIYQNAKKVTVPGAQYAVLNIEFKPSLEEIQAVRDGVRSTLYQKINDELVKINKAYPSQNYTVSNVVFIEGGVPRPMPMQDKAINMMAEVSASAAPMNVSNELQMTAIVEVASNRKLGN